MTPQGASVDALFQEGFGHHQAGRLQQAEAFYRQVLAADPNHADSLHLLGLIAHQVGRNDLAVEYIGQAIRLQPQGAPYYCNLGIALESLGRLAEAENCYRAALQLTPDVAEIHNNLGNLLTRLGRLDEAEASCRAALRVRPQFSDAHINLGNVLKGLGRVAEAEASYRVALILTPDAPGAHYNLGNALLSLGRLAEAEACYRTALRLKPDFVEAHSNLGNVLKDLGRPAEAEASYREALKLNANFADAYHNWSNLLGDLGRWEDAAECSRAVLRLRPDSAEANFNLGNALKNRGRYAEAETSFRAALCVKPDYPEALNNLGSLLREVNRLDEAEVCYDQALYLKPDQPEGRNNRGNVYLDKGEVEQAITEYRRALAVEPGHAVAFSSLLFALCFSEKADPDAVYQEHLKYNARVIAPLRGRRRQHDNSKDPDRKLRIGYLSPDFRRHPGGHFLMPLFEHYDRSRFEVVAYNLSEKSDDRMAAMRQLVDHWCDCATLGDDPLADRIVADGIDILVECTGHMAGTRLTMCGLKPAPILISFPLYPNTTGVETVDYRIMDSYFAPVGAETWHSEKLIRLPDAHVSYAPLPEDVTPSDPSPCVARGYVTFGSFNNFAKVGPSTVAAWARILCEVPSARLRIKWLGIHGRSAGWVTERFKAAGIDPSRIDLVEYASHPYPPYRDIDICLDPLFANGGTTTCDALWMGVPVVTVYGQTPFSRVGLCHMTNIGLPELIARNVDEYVRIAADLARDGGRLARVRHGLREKFARSPLMDGARYTKNLEAEYRRVWAQYCGAGGGAEQDVQDRSA